MRACSSKVQKKFLCEACLCLRVDPDFEFVVVIKWNSQIGKIAFDDILVWILDL